MFFDFSLYAKILYNLRSHALRNINWQNRCLEIWHHLSQIKLLRKLTLFKDLSKTTSKFCTLIYSLCKGVRRLTPAAAFHLGSASQGFLMFLTYAKIAYVWYVKKKYKVKIFRFIPYRSNQILRPSHIEGLMNLHRYVSE